MRERPILFNDAMVRAILSGAKTQTRRPVKRENSPSHGYVWAECLCSEIDPADRPCITCDCRFGDCPFGVPGARLWVLTLRPVPGYEGTYSVGDDGHVYRVTGKSPRRVKGSPQTKGYLTVSLSKRGEIQTHSVHRLVAEAFYPNHEGLDVVRHLDGDPTNNDPTNLDWGTESQNRRDREAQGRGNGESHHSAKLSHEAVAEIRASKESQRALAARFCVSQSTIHAARSGETWRGDVEAPPPNLPRWASRLTLRVTGIRVERVKDITEEDARAEGLRWTDGDPVNGRPTSLVVEARDEFRRTWSDIYGPESWDANPWVWVVSFEREVPNV